MPKLLRSVQAAADKRQELEVSELDELRKLIAGGTPLEDADEFGWTAFMWAVRCGLDHIAQFLQEAGADASRYGDALLIKAVFGADAELARKALACGANPNCQYGGLGNGSALWLATFHGLPKIVEILIQAGARVSLDALTPLGEMDITDYKIGSEEEERRYAEVAQLLLANGASPHIAAYNHQPLIATFPERLYPEIHRVLAGAMIL
jgi:Ankyrin repeats (3 copies)